jgi:cystine transport system substrate-binding protein
MNAISRITSVIILVLSLGACSRVNESAAQASPPPPTQSTLDRINHDGVLRVGYGVWPPYTDVDLNEADPQKQVKGFSVDLIDEIASRADPKLKVEFVRFNWATMKADLESKRFDVVIEPVFMTVPRAQIFAFSHPYSWFGVACAVVLKDDNRFAKFSDLDRSDITVSLAEGWTSTDFAKANLTKPKFKMVLLRDNNFAQLEDVLYGRADVALQDAPTVMQFVAAHSDKVKALWLNTPPSVVAGGFVARPGDAELVNFLNTSLEVLQADGTIRRLDTKWKTLGLYAEPALRPGAGLQVP